MYQIIYMLHMFVYSSLETARIQHQEHVSTLETNLQKAKDQLHIAKKENENITRENETVVR